MQAKFMLYYHMKNTQSKKVLVGLSLPYANGRLHIGHVASSLPADTIARFHRMTGNNVSFVSGSDSYGTPILVASRAEGITPLQLATRYHDFFVQDFKALGFSFDKFTSTTCENHKEWVRQFHTEIYTTQNTICSDSMRDIPQNIVHEKSAMQLYCAKCDKYLPDRYVEGTCPHCKSHSKGDSCDSCGKMIEPEELLEPRCKLCEQNRVGADGNPPTAKGRLPSSPTLCKISSPCYPPTPRMTRQLYLSLSKLEPQIRKFYADRKSTWANNAVGLTGRYLNEGLIDRAISRNIEWGVELPHAVRDVFAFTDAEMRDKRFYCWIEALLGYFSATVEICKKNGWKWEEFLLDDENSAAQQLAPPLHYYVHGKDNIPFHSIILPAQLIANKTRQWHLPDIIVSSEYVNLSGDKISKSKGNLIRAEQLIEAFDIDMIRYYFLRNVNDRKDVNFTFEDFCGVVNGELVNGWGNLVNRSLSFIKSKLNGRLEIGAPAKATTKEIQKTYKDVGALIHAGKANKALQRAWELVNFGNKHFDTCEPWKSIKTDIEKCKRDLGDVVVIIANLTRILSPFIPNSCEKVAQWLGVDVTKWEPTTPTDISIGDDVGVLFQRLDIKAVSEKFNT